jgi:hypothetical protein
LKDFAERHHLELTDILKHEHVAVRAATSANFLITAGYAGLDDTALSDPAVGILLNMFHRNFELVEAGVVAFVTGCGSAAEVTARAAVESSVNLAYIVAGVPKDRLRAYFEHYFQAGDRQLKTWQRESSTLSESDARVQQRGIEKRQRANGALRDFITGVFGPAQELWPVQIEHRFKALDHALGYRTFYARMSAEVHGDAEETIRYLVGELQDQHVFEAMALETVLTTRLYIHYAASCFLRAAIMYAGRYALHDAVSALRGQLEAVQAELMQIGSQLDSDGGLVIRMLRRHPPR